jgi:putative membrane protein
MVLALASVLLLSFATTGHAHIAPGDNPLTAWHWRWDVGLVLIVFALLYLRGWMWLKKVGGEASLSQLLFYGLALVALGCALLSPIDALGSYLLIAHMVQHELLMMVAPPLILLAHPVPVLMWGLGGSARLQAGSLLARHTIIRRARDFLTWMPVAWGLYVINLWAWHHPLFYEAALRVPWIHDAEHVLFFLTALLFWWPVISPVSRPAPVQYGVRVLYLFFAATQDTVLSGLIALSREVLYPHYETAARLWSLTPGEDQVGGGIVMFAVGSVTYAVAILIIVNSLLGEGRRSKSTKGTLGHGAEKVEGRI